MNRYRVEFFVNPKNRFFINCPEDRLENAKAIIKNIQKSEGEGKCFYSKLPLCKNKKVFY